jgi:hypothetical protein
MIFCSSCGKEMSADAVSCPSCGKPNDVNKGLSTRLKIGIFFIPVIFAWFTLRKGVSTSAKIISFVWMLIFLGAGGATQSDNPAKQSRSSSSSSSISSTSSAKPVEVQKVSATSLFREYEKNEISADNKYKGKYVEVSGRIDDIGKDILDDMYITLKGSDFFGVQVYFNEDDSNVVANLSKNSNIKVVCEIEGLMGNVICKDAVIVE